MKDELKKNEKQEVDIEKAREEAFLEGYNYAIKILTEGLVKKEKTEQPSSDYCVFSKMS